MKKLVLHSGGMDSTAIMLDYIKEYGPENVVSLGINYGQRHWSEESQAARRFCLRFGDGQILRPEIDVPISQIGGCSLIDRNKDVTTDMSQQRSTVVPQRNAIFCLFAAAFAQENDCDTIVHGACAEDYEAYRDCRPVFFRQLEITIQAGRTNTIKGSEDIINDMHMDGLINPDKLDLRIETPLINSKKEDTVKRIIDEFGVEPYRYSYTCYNGEMLSCGKCPACIERLNAFKVCGVDDPLEYEEK